jgi:prevent-host-death family protein
LYNKKEEAMKVTASQIRQNSSLLQEALKEDILVTKRERPFVVIMDYRKYEAILEELRNYREAEKGERLSRRWLESAKEAEGKSEPSLYEALGDKAREIMEREL